MKVLALNSSPHMDKGNTNLILSPFLEGMREAGAEVELIYTKKLKVNPCLACLNCWFKTPGKCAQDDDMQMLLPKLSGADIWVLATPVYWKGLYGPMKVLMDRVNPLMQPVLELRDGRCHGRLRERVKQGKIVLVSNGGLWEKDNFDLLVQQMEAFCDDLAWEFAGGVLRPHGIALMPMKEMGRPVDDVFDSAKAAGHQLVEDGKMSPETLSVISRPLMPLEMFVQVANQQWQQALAAAEKK